MKTINKSKANSITYSAPARRAIDLIRTLEYIFMDSFTTVKPNEAGLVGRATLRFTILNAVKKDAIEGWQDPEIVIPNCPVFSTDDGVRVELPRVQGGKQVSARGPYSDEVLQNAFKRECDVFVRAYPDLKSLLGWPDIAVDKEAA
jgi:hypothetical protein